MATPISFTPFLGWVDATDPNNIPPDAKVISASDLLRYENLGVAARDAINEMRPFATDAGIAGLVSDTATATGAKLSDTYAPKALAYDTFKDVANGQRPTIADSGHTWGYHEPQWAEVTDGYLDAKLDATVTYPELDLGAPVTHFGAKFLYDDKGGTLTESGSLTLVSWNDGGVAANGTGRGTRCHASLSKSTIGFMVRAKGNPGVNPLQEIHVHTLAQPLVSGQKYTFEVYLQGDTATIVPPTGAPYTVTEARINSDDMFACWEPFYAATNQSLRSRFRMEEVWANTSPAYTGVNSLAKRVLELENAPAATSAAVAAQQYFSSSDITVTTTNTVIPGIEITATAGPTGAIIWELEAPIAQSGGDGGVGAGSVWFGITTPGSGSMSPDFRASWATQVGPVRRRYVQTGLTPGQTYTKAPFIRKDTGPGTTIINGQRAIVFTGTPA